MDNVANDQIIEETTLADNLLVAHRMVEAYLGADRPVSTVTATYNVTHATQALQAVAGYPIISITSVVDGQGNKIEFTNNDKRIWSLTPWATVVIVQYLGGLEPQIYDAIKRQAEVLETRVGRAPEEDKVEIGGLKVYQNPQYRSGLAPDVKQMVFPFKAIGF